MRRPPRDDAGLSAASVASDGLWRRRVPQDRETTPQVVAEHAFLYRYAYSRSADGRAHEATGQDYIAICENSSRLAFSLCDGVSQSFLGDFAARFVGDLLVEVLWQMDSAELNREGVRTRVLSAFDDVRAEATERVEGLALPSGLNRMLVDVLERKRGEGSESTFTAGVMDKRSNQLVLVWMGDSRIKVWDAHGEPRQEWLGNEFHTRERWSTRHGPVGELHVLARPLNRFLRVAAYSDGLSSLDQQVNMTTNRQLAKAIVKAREAPTSDDMSYLEIITEADPDYRSRVAAYWTGDTQDGETEDPQPTPPGIPRRVQATRKHGVVFATWDAVASATRYEITLSGYPQQIVSGLPQMTLTHPRPPGPETLRVRAVNDTTPGEWSQTIQVVDRRRPTTAIAFLAAAVLLLGLLAAVGCSVAGPATMSYESHQLVGGESTGWVARPEQDQPSGTESMCAVSAPKISAPTLIVVPNSVSRNDALTAAVKFVDGAPVASQSVGLAGRVLDGSNYYLLKAGATDRTLAIYAVTGETSHLLALQTRRFAPGRWYQLRFQISGLELSGFVDGQLSVRAFDDQLSRGGSALWAGGATDACFNAVSVEVPWLWQR